MSTCHNFTWKHVTCEQWVKRRSKTSYLSYYNIQLVHYLLCTDPCCWLEAFGGLILLLGRTISIFWPFSPRLWPGARVSTRVSLCTLSCGTAGGPGFCLFRTLSLPALISFSPTLSTLARPATPGVPGHSFLGEGSLDPAPVDGGRANLEALDILQESR